MAAGTKLLGLQGIFYARFHPERGPSVIVQVPQNGIVASRIHDTQSVAKRDASNTINFSDISAYVIPPYDLCGKSISVRCSKRLVLGWPISLEDEAYSRNRFTFDVCFVLQERSLAESGSEHEAGSASITAWEQVVRKTALFFQALELEDGMLATEEERMERGEDSTVVKPQLESIFDQLRTYSEASVRVDKTHTLNVRLSHDHHNSVPPKQPSKINAWDVPLLVRSLPSAEDWTFDLVLARIIPYINGVNHVAKIAKVGEVDVMLVKRAIKGLVAHGIVSVLDLFHFQAIYTLTEDSGWFVTDQAMREECLRYVTASSNVSQTKEHVKAPEKPPSTGHLLSLYNALSTSQSVHDFVLSHQSQLAGIDIRRVVTFGVLKGFLRRKHKYVLAIAPSSTKPQGKGSGSLGGNVGIGSARSGEDAAKEYDRLWRKAALSSGWPTPPAMASGSFESGALKVSPEKNDSGERKEGEDLKPEEEKLKAFLDGTHCMDEICVAMKTTERKVLERLRGARGRRVFGEVVVFCR